MKASQDLVGPTKKIHVEFTLSVETGSLTDSNNVRKTLIFIYGLGSSGLSPFEFKLAKAVPGDAVDLTLEPDQWEPYFGHLPILWPDTLSQRAQRRVQAKVKAVETPPQREIIQALADLTACGSGCCGNH